MATNRNMVMGIGGLATVGILLFFAGDLGELAGKAIGSDRIGTPEQNALVENAYAVQITHDPDIDLLVTPVQMFSNNEPGFAAAVMEMGFAVDRFYRLNDENEWEGFDGQYYYDEREAELEPGRFLSTGDVTLTIYRNEGTVDGIAVDYDSFYLQFTENGSNFCHYTDPMFPDIDVDVEALNCTPTPGRRIPEGTTDVTSGKSPLEVSDSDCHVIPPVNNACPDYGWECPNKTYTARLCNDPMKGGIDAVITISAASQVTCARTKVEANTDGPSHAGSCIVGNVHAGASSSIILQEATAGHGDCGDGYTQFDEGTGTDSEYEYTAGSDTNGHPMSGGHVYVNKAIGVRDASTTHFSTSLSIAGNCDKKITNGQHETHSGTTEGGESSGGSSGSGESNAGANLEWHTKYTSDVPGGERVRISVANNVHHRCVQVVDDPVFAPGGGGTSVGGGIGTGGDDPPETDGSGGDSMGGNPKGGGH